MLTHSRKQQASDQVFAYMKTVMGSAAGTDAPIRMPSVRQLATHLGVSPSTVAAVYRRMKEEGVMRGAAGSGSFLTQPPNARFEKHIRLTLNIQPEWLDDRTTWTPHLVGGLTVAALNAKRRLTIQCMEDALASPRFDSPQIQDAVLIFPNKTRDRLIDWAREYRFPTVFLNPPTEIATENFASADYFGAGRKLGEALRLAGRKHVLFVCDRPYQKSTSNRLRISGLLTGLEYGADPAMRYSIVFTDGVITEEAGRKALSQYIEQTKSCPDAICSPGDFLALGCLQEMKERGIRCPEDASVIGGTGLNLDRSEHPQLTRISHPFEEIGHRLITVLLDQIAHPNRPIPGQFVPMRWLGGATTTMEENRILFPAT